MKTSHLVVLIGLLCFLTIVSTASGTVLLDEEMYDAKVDTSTATSAGGGQYGGYPRQLWIRIDDIQRFPTINYIAVNFNGNVMPVGISVDGEYPITYTLVDDTTRNGVMYISRNRDVLNQVVSTQYTLFFHDWDIGSATGSHILKLTNNDSYKFDLRSGYFGYEKPDFTDDIGIYVLANGYNGGTTIAPTAYAGGQYSISVVAVNHWRNHLRVSDDHQGMYKIELTRNIGDVSSSSTITAGNWYNHDVTNIIWHIPPTDVDNVTITNIWDKKYIFPIRDSGDLDLTAPATISVRSTQNGALIPGATATILDSQTGTTLVNDSLATGTGTFSLEKSHTLRYLASATADGYTLLSPIQFDTGDSGVSIVLWMSPTGAPTPPENTTEGKTMLYGYLITAGSSQQPIPGATITLNGVGSTTTSSTGSYLFNNIDPGTYTISASATNHDPISESVTAEITATPHNLALKGHYILKVTVKDADTLKTLTNATTISLSDGQEHNDQNPTSFAVDYGTYTITSAAEGYYPATQYQYIDKPGETQATVLMTPKTPAPTPAPAPEYPNYPPHNVRFHCIDDFGLPLSNVSVSAAYLETTSPWSWFTDLLGIPSTVAINETTLAGTTGTDGSITFSMVEVVRYAITAHDPASNLSVNFTLYPQETQYTIQFRTRPPSDAETHPLYNLEAVPNEDNSQVSLRLAYKDRDNATTSLLFWVKDSAGEYVHTESLTPKYLNWTNASYTVENHPASYTWGFDATHATRDTISAARSITLHGSGRLVDLGFEDEFWYLLLSAIWIVGIGAIFSGSRVRFGAIIIPLIGGGVPTLIGWLPLATTVPIGILTFIGVFVYMRKSEYKLYR